MHLCPDLRTILECAQQLEWLWVPASPCGKMKNFSRLAKLACGLGQLDGSVGAERDLEDYMGIPETNVTGRRPMSIQAEITAGYSTMNLIFQISHQS